MGYCWRSLNDARLVFGGPLKNLVCQYTGHRENDFAISIKYGQEPASITPVGNSAHSPEPLPRPLPAMGADADILDV
jgi:hypothetical protein